jgi:hypothetical protein
MVGVRLFAALLFIIPLGASATIYQWTDEQGNAVLGNQVPATARNVRVVIDDSAPTPATSNAALEARIAQLERQLQAQQYAPPAPAAYPAPAPYPAAPPPMPPDYYGYGASYYPAMYPPPYYPYGYGYPLGVVRVGRPVRGFVHARHFASRPMVMHHAAVGRR